MIHFLHQYFRHWGTTEFAFEFEARRMSTLRMALSIVILFSFPPDVNELFMFQFCGQRMHVSTHIVAIDHSWQKRLFFQHMYTIYPKCMSLTEIKSLLFHLRAYCLIYWLRKFFHISLT